MTHLRELLGRRRDLAAAHLELRLEDALVIAELRVGEAELAEQAMILTLEPEALDELVDDLHQVLQLPRLGDHVVEVSRVDRRDQILGLREARDNGGYVVEAASARNSE